MNDILAFVYGGRIVKREPVIVIDFGGQYKDTTGKMGAET